MFHSSLFTRLGALALVTLFSATLHAEKNPVLPDPYETPSTEKPSTVLGWHNGNKPKAPAGYKVTTFANLPSPRRLYQLPSGDILVSQAKRSPNDPNAKSPNKITFFKMNGSKYVSRKPFIQSLNLPFGMVATATDVYVAEPERILRFPYKDDHITSPGVTIATLPFPAPQRHWTRDLVLNANGDKLFVSVGSVSNVGESPDPLNPMNAAILEMNLDGSDVKIFASGLRNAVTMALEPITRELWASVNERDELGDGLVPDYITHVQRDGFYGWPYAYWGPHEDPRQKGVRPDLVAKTIVPDFSVGAHTASLGITFTYTGITTMNAPFNEGALISQHGSWNSSVLVGYKVLYVPFIAGQAVDPEQDFLTGFIDDPVKGTVYGRPVSSLVLADGTVLVADDAGGKIWKVSPVHQP